jgi:hypothetical protein
MIGTLIGIIFVLIVLGVLWWGRANAHGPDPDRRTVPHDCCSLCFI